MFNTTIIKKYIAGKMQEAGGFCEPITRVLGLRVRTDAGNTVEFSHNDVDATVATNKGVLHLKGEAGIGADFPNGVVLPAGVVETVNIKDANVVAAKLAVDAVGTSKIKALAITNAKIASNSVSTSKLVDDDVTEVKLDAVVRAKLNNHVFVTDYAVGDGVADDTVAIATAISAAVGKVLYFPAGVYLASQIVIPSNSHLVLHGDAILKKEEGSEDLKQVSITGDNVIFEGGKIDGQSSTVTSDYDGVCIDGGSHVTIDNVYVYSQAKHAFGVKSGGDYITFKNCRADTCLFGGLYVIDIINDSSTQKYITVEDCVFDFASIASADGLKGIFIGSKNQDTPGVYLENVRVSNCVVLHAPSTGILTHSCIEIWGGSANISVTGCVVEGAGLGISFNYVNNGTITGCVVRNSFAIGYELDRCLGVSVVGNAAHTITSGGGVSIAGASSSGAETSDFCVIGNAITDAKWGVYLHGIERCRGIINGNEFVNYSSPDNSNGIYLASSSVAEVTVSGNYIRGFENGIYLTNATDVIISDNTIAGCTYHAIELASTIDRLLINSNQTIDCPLFIYKGGVANLGSEIRAYGNSDGVDYVDFENKILKMHGNGSPESVVTAGVGSQYIRINGGVNSTLYIKESGTGNTGWSAV